VALQMSCCLHHGITRLQLIANARQPLRHSAAGPPIAA
jgi:hypothetical protein